MMVRRLAFLIALVLAACGDVIGIRDLGVEPQTTVPTNDGGSAGPIADAGPPADSFVPNVGVDGATCPHPNIGGAWKGAFVAMLGDAAYPFSGGSGVATGSVDQNCTFITGQMTIEGCLSNGRLQATIDDAGRFEGNVTKDGILVTLVAPQLTATQINGNFVIPAFVGACSAQSGTFKLTRP